MTDSGPGQAPDYNADSITVLPQPKTLYDYFDRMRERPAMWLGSGNLSALWDFANAYQCALSTHGIDEKLDPPFEEFHEFCAHYFKSASAAGWCRIILADNFGQEEQALRQFFPLFDQFRAREDVLLGRRSAMAFAHELMFQQTKWRAALPDLDQVLTVCEELVRSIFRARIAHEYDSVVRDLEGIAETHDSVARILAVAKCLGSS
jgi:hypothetical protein